MQVHSHSHPRTACLLVGAALAFTSLYAADAAKPASTDKDALPVFEDSITLSGQSNWVTGDKAAFQARDWTSKKGFYGVENYQSSNTTVTGINMKVDGHALPGAEDYLVHFSATKNDVGSFDSGYKRFRTYYDNAGGFFLPTANSWLPMFPHELAVDRSKFWAEAKLTLPDAPVLTLRYTNELRNGRKDSTIWGATDYTGITGNYYIGTVTAAAFNNNSTPVATNASRYIAPSYIELGERHQTLEGIATHTIGNTTIELSIVGDQVNNLDTRYLNRYPGEVRIPAIATTANTTTIVALPNAWRMNNEVDGYDRVGNDAHTLTTSAKIETTITPALKVYGGISYSSLNSDFKEDRPNYTVTTYPINAPTGYVFVPTSQASGLVGGARIGTLTANLGADYKVANNLTAEVALKGEDRYAHASDSYQTIAAGNPAVLPSGVINTLVVANIKGASHSKEDALTPEVGLRYTGIKNISLYGTAEYRYVKGNESVTPQYNSVTAVASPTYSDVNENHGRYTIGANWVPCTFFTLRGETFYKDHQNNFQYYATSSSQFVLGYKLKGARLTATVKPIPTITLTTRYVYQSGTMDTASAVSLNYQSMDSKSHNIGETIDWTPIKQFYMQGNVNVVFDTTSTSYPRAGDMNAASGGNSVLHNADNNYWNGSVIAGVVVDKVTNAELQYTSYKSNNFEPALIATTVPYGTSQKDYTVTIGVKRKLADDLVAEIKLGYMNSKNETTGGNTGYNAKVAYVSVTQAF